MNNVSDEVMSRVESIRKVILDSSVFPQDQILKLANLVVSAFKKGQKIVFIGNGGSAAEAIHLAAEFTGKCVYNHRPLPALCLNESQSALTAIANDFGIEEMFVRQIKAHLQRDDILIAMSTSGTSINIKNALIQSVNQGVISILWSGSSCPDYPGVEIWRVPTTSTPRIQEVHLMWGHILAEIVEQNFED